MNAVLALIGLVSVTAAAQTVTVYSEFTRIDPYGQIVRADRSARPPREILSPALARNAFWSFQAVLEGSAGQPFRLRIAQNPEDAVRVTGYRELYAQSRGEWIPDALEAVTLPFESKIGGGEIADQTAQSFWVDVFVPGQMPVSRIKIEVQVYLDGTWIRYPMEARIVRAALGNGVARTAFGVGEVAQPSAASAIAGWVEALCGTGEKNTLSEPLSIRNLIARNAAQDVRFAAGMVPAGILRLAGVTERVALCSSGRLRADAPGDEYLAIRDELIGARE